MKKFNLSLYVVLLLFFLFYFTFVTAIPEGPTTIAVVSNATRSSLNNGTFVNYTDAGAYITYINLTAVQTNTRWKGFVGNVMGLLVLQSAMGSTLYDWTMSSTLTGEVYASRSNAVTWAKINCTWAWGNGGIINLSGVNNRSFEANESAALGGFTADDNISATFDVRDHPAVDIGTVNLPANYCWNTNPYVNNASDGSKFDELVLYDNTSLVYATILEQDQAGYDSKAYDFELIVPQGNATGSRGYYIYVEVV